MINTEGAFNNVLYRRHNARRQEHLASLGLDLKRKKVLEVGAGTGDHSSFFIDRGCDILITEARVENIKVINAAKATLERIAYSVGLSYQEPQGKIEVAKLDIDKAPPNFRKGFDVCYSYGLLYHLEKPAEAIKFMADRCELLLLETCVSFGDEDKLNAIKENKNSPTQSFNGGGCRPTRLWVWNQLKKHFKFVYIPKTQPCHPAFPIDWGKKGKTEHKVSFVRAVFVASKTELQNEKLSDKLLNKQERHY